MVIGKGCEDRFLTEAEVRDIFARALAGLELAGKRVLVIIPDGTRSAPLPLCFRLLHEHLGAKVARLDFLVALGTHAKLDEARLCQLVGITPAERAGRYAAVGLFNHDFERDLRRIGTISAAELHALTGGLLARAVPVEVNRRLFDYEHLIICGPVFPHEAAGFSGGSKYFFPGASGPGVINTLHWLSALVTNLGIIGRRDTPVRRLIERAASLIQLPKSCFSMVVMGHDDLAGLYFGTPEESQRAALALSERVHIEYLDRQFQTVLAVMPEMYDDIWTAGKGMYKTEPIVADGGTVILYAPHIDEVSYTHGALLDRVGYHVRDYFLAHWREFEDVPGCVKAHSTLVKGAGTYRNGVEKPRIDVVLATRIPRERCARLNLGYLDPDGIRLEEWCCREDEGILVLPRAGELLYRLAE